ncbi:ABC transporter permease [Kibdelosporangium lantanae]
MKTSVRGKLLPPVLAIVFSVLLCTVALLISGDNPLTAFGAMVGQLGKGTTLVDTINSGAVYYIAGLAVAIGFQMNLFNIGVEGQYRFAGVVAAIFGGEVALPPGLHTIAIIIVAVLAGALYALVPALLKVFRGVSEVISTIMLNAIAIGLIAYLAGTDAFGVQVGNNISTRPIESSGWVPGIPIGSGSLFGFVFIAALIGVGYWVMLNRTRFGFELKASGESPTAATAGGVDARKMVMTAMLLSGGIAGMTALPELLGRDHEYLQTSPAGYGFVGIAVALLGRNNPGGIALGALLWAYLDKSAVSLDNVGVPQEMTIIMQGAIVLSVVVAYEIVRRFELAAEQRRVGRQLAAGGAV